MILIHDSNEFFKIQQTFTKIPYQQSHGWYNYVLQLNKEILFFVDSLENTQIAFWGVLNKVPIIRGKIFTIQGECFDSCISEKKIESCYSHLKNLGYLGVEIFSDNKYNIIFEIGLKLAGFRRPLGSFNSNLSIEIDLNKKIQYDNNWKGNIRKGFKNELNAFEITDFSTNNLSQIIMLIAKMADSKKLKHHNTKSLESLVLSNDYRTFMAISPEFGPISVVIIHTNKPYSTFVIAANSPEAKTRFGSHFLVDYVVNCLKSENFEFFDLCRIPVSNSEKNGIYNFKKGTRGKKIQYNGEFSYFNLIIIELLIMAYRILVNKKSRY
ncbi:hypothetical protein QWY87_02955 [Lutimonas halocynthiae]|uniref:hypothetical protein n=1 Tax=Lutimonas halocynthiae TaxID=1446477 RepID=UPI0025B2DF1A|nr:hypothetical protein [Lutimonas halocynthiae]MDN3641644.1 hypothetical protein [Lutimonas halocynthiae]